MRAILSILIPPLLIVGTQPARAQWHDDGAVDEVITRAGLDAWTHAHGEEFVSASDAHVIIENPNDDRAAARFAEYVPAFATTQGDNGPQSYECLVLRGVSEPSPTRAWDGPFHAITRAAGRIIRSVEPAIFLLVGGIVGIIAGMCIWRDPPQRLSTVALSREVERRFFERRS